MSRYKKTASIAEVQLFDENPIYDGRPRLDEHITKAESAQYRVLQYPGDFLCKFTATGEEVLYCTWCDKIINTKSSRVSEHLRSIKHLENKLEQGGSATISSPALVPLIKPTEMVMCDLPGTEQRGVLDPPILIDEYPSDLEDDHQTSTIKCKYCPRVEITNPLEAVNHVDSKLHADHKQRIIKEGRVVKKPPPPLLILEDDECEEVDFYKIRGICALLSDLPISTTRTGVTDLEFICADGNLYFYKAVLAHYSSFFKACFSQPSYKRDLFTVFLPDIRTRVLKGTLQYLLGATVVFKSRSEMHEFRDAFSLLELDSVCTADMLRFESVIGPSPLSSKSPAKKLKRPEVKSQTYPQPQPQKRVKLEENHISKEQSSLTDSTEEEEVEEIEANSENDCQGMIHESLDLMQGLEGDVDEKAMDEDRKNMDEDVDGLIEDGEGLDDDEDDEDYNDCVEYTGDSLLVIGEEEEERSMVKEEGIDDDEEEKEKGEEMVRKEGEVEKNEKGEPEKKETKMNKIRSKNDNDMM
ncbi:uncharacterized protein LOC111715673 [Eurytemora carolleeae]|uniref:uncharacterized protein LOC111715673 n=1 Tax=Eurytemora carolleeae TaxID=1294199 RepID=UPI000C7914BB|nr:uncharacterized protein LOC111715673 [Eurytemora carolleeae]|eukprot:XP_023346802.1 uncharacterized protein LOC111715673 [Eurytemora affinis]